MPVEQVQELVGELIYLKLNVQYGKDSTYFISPVVTLSHSSTSFEVISSERDKEIDFWSIDITKYVSS